MQKRELKFRYALERNGELKLFDISLVDCEIKSSIFERFRQLIVFEGWSMIGTLQYTCKRDNNGKEIYEGDILKDNYDRILLVEWYKHGFSFKAITETNFLRARDINQWFENEEIPPEIIGNIFENPELAKGTNVKK